MLTAVRVFPKLFLQTVVLLFWPELINTSDKNISLVHVLHHLVQG